MCLLVDVWPIAAYEIKHTHLPVVGIRSVTRLGD